jgi:hypothetical protein
MLHAHALNAHKIDELISMLKRRGYEFVTLDQALQDKAYGQTTTLTGPWGISWLERWAMERGHKLKREPLMSDFMRGFDITRGGTDYNKQGKTK